MAVRFDSKRVTFFRFYSVEYGDGSEKEIFCGLSAVYLALEFPGIQAHDMITVHCGKEVESYMKKRRLVAICGRSTHHEREDRKEVRGRSD